ncbi:sulfur reduction protein DsrE [Bizionia argentinensis JUB59]|uniref:Sulfur reduction protein DsrE n=1 Tax=Bizionia argentinensis JUB59 TaxID=1046627 RepID=G2EA00_9FLAO|nr:sulfur reduction protein DsrE [Bizionia argentinensis]EGV44956.2 sulfur reduction protein DsrE [Bizionia argentinensis JUB59]
MKTYIFSSVLFIMTLFAHTDIQAQQVDSSKNNYVVLTKKIPQLQPIILTAQALKAEEGNDFGQFKVIICGRNIGDITNPEKMKNFIGEAEKAGVELIACGFSMNKFKVDKSKIPNKINTVENGILHNFQLQKQGYKSLSL